jgi:short-subunit dehydrogenase
MGRQFEGMKKAIVVGASSGIGMEVATVETNAVGFTRMIGEAY